MPPLRTAAEPPRYPARRFKPSALFGFQAQAAFEALQLKTAIDYFLSLLAQAAPPLDPETKTALIPMLSALVGLGWPRDAALDILYAVPHDTKSCARADMAFKSIGDFVRRCGTAQADALHIALHDIGVILRDASRKYDPNQPRVPAGNGDGGQWTDGGIGHTGSGGRFALRKPPKNPLLQDAMTRKPPHLRRPEDMLEGGGARGGGAYGGRQTFKTPSTPTSPAANRAVGKIQKLDKQGAYDLQDAMTARAAGRTSPKESNPQIRDAADDIERFLGGKIEPNDIKPSKSGDLVIQKGDKKFRMDVKNPGKLKDRKTPDDPHFHFEQIDKNGKWADASDTHKNYFQKD